MTSVQHVLSKRTWHDPRRDATEATRLLATVDGFSLSGRIRRSGTDDVTYQIDVDARWATRSCVVETGDGAWVLFRSTERSPEWELNGDAAPELSGCVDIEFDFSPATRALPVNRSGLSTGMTVSFTSAWLDETTGALDVRTPAYTRITDDTWVYRSGTDEHLFGVDAHGLPTWYATDLAWRPEFGL